MSYRNFKIIEVYVSFRKAATFFYIFPTKFKIESEKKIVQKNIRHIQIYFNFQNSIQARIELHILIRIN